MENTQVVLSGETPGSAGAARGVSRRRNISIQYPNYQRRRQAVAPPWFNPGQEAQIQPDQQPQPRRRGLFGRRWFQPNYGDQGYYPPQAPRYYQPRGYGY